jgi:hypothetical protein
MDRHSRVFASCALAAMLVFTAMSVCHAQEPPQWQGNILWSMRDTGAPDCPWLYVNNPAIQSCLLYGNRVCVMQVAVQFAKQNQDWAAFGLTLVTHCHNDGARSTIQTAGPQAVGEFLRRF